MPSQRSERSQPGAILGGTQVRPMPLLLSPFARRTGAFRLISSLQSARWPLFLAHASLPLVPLRSAGSLLLWQELSAPGLSGRLNQGSMRGPEPEAGQGWRAGAVRAGPGQPRARAGAGRGWGPGAEVQRAKPRCMAPGGTEPGAQCRLDVQAGH